MKNIFEVIIIGGGPAGSSAALYLAEAGFRVCLIEKKIFPREKLCGEFLSAEVINSLHELNLFSDFMKLKPNEITSFRFINNNEDQLAVHLPFTAFGMRRSLFDNLLLTEAGKRGVIIMQPAEVKSIEKTGNNFSLLVKEESGEEVNLDSKILIAAYGKQNSLDRNIGRNFAEMKSGLNGVKFHIKKNLLKNLREDEIQIFAAEGIYCGVNAVDNDKVTVCFLEDRKIAKSSPREQLKKLSEKNRKFNSLFAESPCNIFDALPVYGTGNIYFGKRNLICDGIYLIGDAAGVIAPLAGDGIGMAITASKILSEILILRKMKKVSAVTSFQLYEAEWTGRFNRRMKIALLIQRILLNNYLRYLGTKAAAVYPSIIPFLINATRR